MSTAGDHGRPARRAAGGTTDFDALYRDDPDPWRVAESPYEQRKLDLLLAVLGRPSYALAWDIGCGTGHLTRRLGDRATMVVGTDTAAEAVQLTEQRCAGRDHIRARVSTLPDQPPITGRPDLIMVSEVFYYLDDHVRTETIAMIDAVAAPVSELVAVHWKGVPEEGLLSGLGAQHDLVSRLAVLGWSHQTHHDDVEFVIDTLVRRQRRRLRAADAD